MRSLDLQTALMSENLVVSRRLGLSALLTVSVHCRDVIDAFIVSGVVRQDDFQWTRYGSICIEFYLTFNQVLNYSI